MFKHWILHRLLVYPILLCLLAWVESAGHVDGLRYCFGGHRECSVNSQAGTLRLDYVNAGQPLPAGWALVHDRTARHLLFDGYDNDGEYRYVWGFGWGTLPNPVDWEDHWVAVPYYFLILVLSAVYLLVRWKGRKVREPLPVLILFYVYSYALRTSRKRHVARASPMDSKQG